ncbi:MAG: YceD family protein [Pseudolabrys sp.]
MSKAGKPDIKIDWAAPITLDEVAEAGRHVELVAPAPVLPAIATLAGVNAVSRLVAHFDVSHRGDGLRVAGQVEGEVAQTCVVTLEPLVNEVREPVDLVFSPSLRDDEGEVEVAGDPDDRDPREPMIGRSVDLAAVAVEFLMLGIDPYPRKSGVEFETRTAGDASEPDRPNPFAVLEALKRNESKGGS